MCIILNDKREYGWDIDDIGSDGDDDDHNDGDDGDCDDGDGGDDDDDHNGDGDDDNDFPSYTLSPPPVPAWNAWTCRYH